MKVALGALGVGTLAGTSIVGGMAIDKSRGDTFNSMPLSLGTAVAMAGMLPGIALAFTPAKAASTAFMGATILGVGAGAIAGRSMIGFAPQDR